MNLHQFYFDVWTIARENRWRIGQALFNHLWTVRPDLSEQLRGGPDDPFQCSSPTDVRYDSAVKFIERHWNFVDDDGTVLNPMALNNRISELETEIVSSKDALYAKIGSLESRLTTVN